MIGLACSLIISFVAQTFQSAIFSLRLGGLESPPHGPPYKGAMYPHKTEC